MPIFVRDGAIGGEDRSRVVLDFRFGTCREGEQQW